MIPMQNAGAIALNQHVFLASANGAGRSVLTRGRKSDQWTGQCSGFSRTPARLADGLGADECPVRHAAEFAPDDLVPPLCHGRFGDTLVREILFSSNPVDASRTSIRRFVKTRKWA